MSWPSNPANAGVMVEHKKNVKQTILAETLDRDAERPVAAEDRVCIAIDIPFIGIDK